MCDEQTTVDTDQEPTVFEQIADLQIELTRKANLPTDHLPAHTGRETPKWIVKITERFCKTILKPILKLRPNGTVNWRDYGRMIGIFERYETFILHDIDRIWKEEGFDKITDEQWRAMEPGMGEAKLRAFLISRLGRPVEDNSSLDALIEESLERQFEYLAKLKEIACWHVAQQNAKTSALFFKGMAEGYTCFLDVDGQFVGDRGRTSIYMDFIAYHLEIEKFRRTMPVKSRRDLQNWIIKKTKIRISRDGEWFDHFCDEICLSMKGVGRTPKPQVS